MARRYQDYTEEDRAAILATLQACAGNVAECSRRSGVPEQTIRDWRDGKHAAPSPQSVDEKRKPLADIFEEIAYSACGVAPDKMEEASFAQVMTGAAIAVDKMRLLREQPTSIGEHREPATVEERDQRAIDLMEKAKLRLVSGG